MCRWGGGVVGWGSGGGSRRQGHAPRRPGELGNWPGASVAGGRSTRTRGRRWEGWGAADGVGGRRLRTRMATVAAVSWDRLIPKAFSEGPAEAWPQPPWKGQGQWSP